MRTHYFAALFFSSILFFVLKYAEQIVGPSYLIAAGLLGFVGAVALSWKTCGNRSVPYMFLLSVINLAIFPLEYAGTVFLHMAFLFFALHYLWPERRHLIHPPYRKLYQRLFESVLLLLLLIALSMIFGVIVGMLGGSADQGKIIETVEGLPLYVLAFSFIVAPFTEELFFRAFLVPRAGPLAASVMFALVHHAYGSVAEMAGAFLLGLVLSYYYYRRGDILPCILAHGAFNLLSVLIIKVVMG